MATFSIKTTKKLVRKSFDIAGRNSCDLIKYMPGFVIMQSS